MCKYMSWHDDHKDKWMSTKGFDTHAGVDAPHVVKIRHPGNGKEEMHSHSLTDKSAWKLCHNENTAGDNPYSVSNPEMGQAIMQRSRDLNKEKKISEAPFSSTCRPLKCQDDKVNIQTLHMMEKINKAYNMVTKKSPASVMKTSHNRTN